MLGIVDEPHRSVEVLWGCPLSFKKGASFQCISILSRFLPLLLHKELVRHQGDEFPIRRLVVFPIDVVAEEGVQVLDLGVFRALRDQLVY